MSRNIIKQALVSSPTVSESKASRTDALLKAAIDTAQPARLRNYLREMCKTPPDARKVTAALLLATQQQYRRRIAECTVLLEESKRGPDQGDYDTSREEEGSGHSVFEDEVPDRSADAEKGEEEVKRYEDVETTLIRNKRV